MRKQRRSEKVRKVGLSRLGWRTLCDSTQTSLVFFTPSLLSRRLLSRFVLINKRLEQAAIKADKKHMIDVISSSFAISGSVRNLSWHWFTIILYSLQLTQFPLNFYLSLSPLSLSPLSPPLSPLPPPPPSLSLWILLSLLKSVFYLTVL